jgi:hypothetical protein
VLIGGHPFALRLAHLPPVWELCDRLDAAHAEAVKPKPLDPTDVPRRRRW